MRRLAAVVGALLGIVLPFVALAPLTAWLILPGHLVFTMIAATAPVMEGWDGHPEAARVWGGLYLVASVVLVAALELGSQVHGATYVWLPWTAMLSWGWMPPIASGVGGWLGQRRRRRLSRAAVLRRRDAAQGAASKMDI